MPTVPWCNHVQTAHGIGEYLEYDRYCRHLEMMLEICGVEKRKHGPFLNPWNKLGRLPEISMALEYFWEIAVQNELF